MPNNAKRELKERHFRGEILAANVTDWLNGEEREYCGKASRSSRQRILDLILCIHETLDIISTGPSWNSTSHPPQNVRSAAGELNAKLAKYPTVPDFNVDREREWSFDIGIDGVTPRVPPGETLAALAVVDLTKQKLLDRVRHCICGNWFFARFAHQQSCSAKCRHKNYEQSEEFKANRRTYMRNYYRLKTSGKVK
jgi:hypothetical protein